MTEDIRPEEFNLVRLPIPVPHMMETALGYAGDKQYVAFRECRISTEGLIVEDGAEIRPGIEPGWSLFRKHPAVARVLETIHLDLTRTLPRILWGEWIALPTAERERYLSKTRCLVLDRQARRLYAGNYINTLMFLSVKADSDASKLDDDDEITDYTPEASNGPRKEERDLSAPQPVELTRSERPVFAPCAASPSSALNEELELRGT
jgi:hypothetical protein